MLIVWSVLILFELNLKLRFVLLLGLFGELMLNDFMLGILGSFCCYLFWILKFFKVWFLFLVNLIRIWLFKFFLLKVIVCFIIFLLLFLVILLFIFCMVLWSVLSILLCCFREELGLSLKLVIMKLLGIFGKKIKCIMLLLNKFMVKINIVINIDIVV